MDASRDVGGPAASIAPLGVRANNDGEAVNATVTEVHGQDPDIVAMPPGSERERLEDRLGAAAGIQVVPGGAAADVGDALDDIGHGSAAPALVETGPLTRADFDGKLATLTADIKASLAGLGAEGCNDAVAVPAALVLIQRYEALCRREIVDEAVSSNWMVLGWMQGVMKDFRQYRSESRNGETCAGVENIQGVLLCIYQEDISRYMNKELYPDPAVVKEEVRAKYEVIVEYGIRGDKDANGVFANITRSIEKRFGFERHLTHDSAVISEELEALEATRVEERRNTLEYFERVIGCFADKVVAHRGFIDRPFCHSVDQTELDPKLELYGMSAPSELMLPDSYVLDPQDINVWCALIRRVIAEKSLSKEEIASSEALTKIRGAIASSCSANGFSSLGAAKRVFPKLWGESILAQ